MGQPQARLTDFHACTVPPPGAPPPFMACFIPPCASTVLVSGVPAARAMTDMTVNGMGLPHAFPKGSMTVVIGKFPALRMGDMCFLGGPLIPPCAPTVLTGG